VGLGGDRDFTMESTLNVDLSDIYHGRQVNHVINISNSDLKLSSQYRIINQRIPICLPLTHDQVTIDIELQIQKIGSNRLIRKPLKYTLNIQSKQCNDVYRVGESDLLVTTMNPQVVRLFDQIFAIKTNDGEPGPGPGPGLYLIRGLGLSIPDCDKGSLYILVLSAGTGPVQTPENGSTSIMTYFAEKCDLREILKI
jgi:hypothetical protein